MLKKSYTRILWLFSCLAVSSCVENQSGDSAAAADSTATSENATNGNLIKYGGEIFSVPSPVQTAILLRNGNAKYKDELLNDISKTKMYVSEYQKALNLGIYGADLAYLASFGNKQKSIEYFKEVEQLCVDLDIKAFIDNSIISRFYENIDNSDSLYAINAEFYRAGDRYLKDSERNRVAGLIIAGGWVEALYFTVDAARSNPDIRKRVGEQKSAVSSLIRLIAQYEDESIAAVAGKLRELEKSFESLEVQYEFQKPIHDAANRTTYLKSRSNVEVSDEKLDEIQGKVTEVRNLIIQ
jgi:hypothetical protein